MAIATCTITRGLRSEIRVRCALWVPNIGGETTAWEDFFELPLLGPEVGVRTLFRELGHGLVERYQLREAAL